MPRELKSTEEIQKEVSRLIHENREVREDQSTVGVPLPTMLREPDNDGCNWVMSIFRNPVGYEGLIGSVVMNVKKRWNVKG